MRKIVNINRKWAFSKMAEDVPEFVDKRWEFVNLPHTWNNIDGQDGGADYYRGCCFYAKEIDKEELPEADEYYLEINGANSSCDVYVGGKHFAHHDGGYSTWRVNITEGLKKSNFIVISVDNGENDSVYPQMADFTFYGGLYRDVNIIAVNKAHFDLDYYGGSGIMITPEIIGSDAQIKIKTFLSNTDKSYDLKYVVKDAQKNTVFSQCKNAEETEISFYLKDVHLWNGKKDPYLYTSEVRLLKDGNIIDNISTDFGCRSFEIDASRGFILNGREYPLRGVSRHQDRWEKGNALSYEDHREDIELICELGATTVRLAHYQHSQTFYDLCDEKGIIVWAEIPYISKHMPSGFDNSVSQMKELIIQNYNHPSIIVWGISNEISIAGSNDDLLENHRVLNDIAHEMDKTRPTTAAVVSMCDINDPYIRIPDVISYNHYFGWYGGDTSMNGPWFDNFHKKFPDIPIGLSEYGCEALDWHSSKPTQGDYSEEYQAFYHEELIKQIMDRPYLWSTYVWNMFDFGADARNEGGENGQNHKGLITFDRKYKKDSFYAYKAWLSDEPFVHICGKRYVERAEDVTKVTVYSNQNEVELFINGKSIGKQKKGMYPFFYFDVENKGETEITAKANGCEDKSLIKKTDEFNDKYRLKEKGAVINWFDIKEIDGYFSINDKLNDIMESDEGKKVLVEIMSNFKDKAKNFSPAGFEMSDTMMKMMGGFTVVRILNMMGTVNIKITKEQILDLNNKLNKIKKPI